MSLLLFYLILYLQNVYVILTGYEKGNNDVWVHFVKKMVSHAYISVILCVWHTILILENINNKDTQFQGTILGH